MPPVPTGVAVGSRRLPLEALTLPPTGSAVPGRFVVVGVRSPSECVFALRHAFIGSDLGFPAAFGRPFCGVVRVQGGSAAVSVLLRFQHALLFAAVLAFGPLLFSSMPLLLGLPLTGGWILWHAVSLHRSVSTVACDAVWALGLAARGESPWQTYA